MNKSAVEQLRKEGYPLKIIGNDGYKATLYDIQPLTEGEHEAIYRYPGGECCHSLTDIAHFEVIEQ